MRLPHVCVQFVFLLQQRGTLSNTAESQFKSWDALCQQLRHILEYDPVSILRTPTDASTEQSTCFEIYRKAMRSEQEQMIEPARRFSDLLGTVLDAMVRCKQPTNLIIYQIMCTSAAFTATMQHPESSRNAGNVHVLLCRRPWSAS